MALHDILMQRANLHFQNEGLGPNVLPPNNLWSNIGNEIARIMNEKKDEQRKQQNIKDQLETYNSMMEQMAGMPDNSDIGKSGNLTEDDVKQRRTKIVGSSTMIPTREVSFGPDGLNVKLGFKSASPTDQKNLIEIDKARADMAREESKRAFIDGFIRGEIPEGAFLKEMGNLGLTPEEFETANAARTKLESFNMQGQGTPIPMKPQGEPQETPIVSQNQGTPVPSQPPQVPEGQVFDKYDAFGNAVYRPMNPTEKKAELDIQEVGRKKQEETSMVRESAQSMLNTINEIENNIEYFGPMGNVSQKIMPLDTKRANWDANVNRLKDKLVVDLMMKMKQASKTGATGFGQLSEKEGQRLENAATALQKGLKEEDAKKYLKELKNSARKVLGVDDSKISQADALAELKRRGLMQ